jgi:predicted nuclease of restriction endonuclease-like (RecB) superfamily
MSDDPDRLAGYAALLDDVKGRVRSAQVRASLSANRELVLLYWSIGRDILARQASLGWGAKVVDRLAADLGRTFPEMKGFSARNLKYMRAFAEAWPDADFVQQAAARLPWFHNVAVIERVKDLEARRFYVAACAEHGWSRNVLALQIDSRLHERQGRAPTNFAATLPTPQSDLAQQMTKDPYVFEFLSLSADARERDLERGLLAHLRDFLLELGVGFAFVGTQVHLEIADEDFYLDLLFYHLRLRCFVVVELKVGPFQPEYRQAELLPLGRRRAAEAPRGPADHRHPALQGQEGPRRRVRPSRSRQADRRRELGDPPRGAPARRAGREPADGGGDGGRARPGHG